MSLMSPALTGGFFTTSATWEVLWKSLIKVLAEVDQSRESVMRTRAVL